MNPALAHLKDYPFQRLAALKADLSPPADIDHIALSIGEPKHSAPPFVVEHLRDGDALRASLGTYPATRGSDALREAIAGWCARRFDAHLDPATQILPCSGTREALFSFGQSVLSGAPESIGMLPNPFYQIYEGALIMRGATPYYLATPAERGFLPDFGAVPESIWRRTELLYLCSPGNPTGAVTGLADYEQLLELRDRYGFVIAADECYSEIYADEAPLGLLEACARTGRDSFTGCVAFNSLSKRSNLPGLRSGFVAGDARLIAPFFDYRTYHGCAMPALVQSASALAWADEAHVSTNRAAYREKFSRITPVLAEVLDVSAPPAGFFLWPRTPKGGEAFTRELFERAHVTVLPGAYLSRRGADGSNPGFDHVRIALVAPLDECVEAAQRIRASVAR
ncbi:MAG: succinyldiaminopimelate transaminase [Pseudomonadota bacterium]